MECQSTWPSSDFTGFTAALNMVGEDASVTNATCHIPNDLTRPVK